LSLFEEAVGREAGVLILVSATGAFVVLSAGLKLATGEGELVCAFTTGSARANAAPAQRNILRRLNIDEVKVEECGR
jgi:hypothetical protein